MTTHARLRLSRTFEHCRGSRYMGAQAGTESACRSAARLVARPASWSVGHRWAYVALILIGSILGGTALAQASFVDVAAAPTTLGTYDIPASASLSGSFNCSTQRTMTVNITGFGRVDKATGYTLTLAEPGANPAVTTQNLTATQTTTTITRATSRAGSFTLNLTARVGTWTSDTPLTRTLTCP